jgi:DNA repair ATPase RecN
MSKMFASAKIGETLNPQIEALRKLGLTEEEIKEVLEDDKRIDRGEKLFELTADQEQASKKARQVSRAPTVYKLDNIAGKRSKKANEVKAGLIELLSAVIKEQPACNSLEIINNEREFVFSWMGTKYKVVLSAPRS